MMVLSVAFLAACLGILYTAYGEARHEGPGVGHSVWPLETSQVMSKIFYSRNQPLSVEEESACLEPTLEDEMLHYTEHDHVI